VNDASARSGFSVAEASAMLEILERVLGRMLQMTAQVRTIYARLEEAGFQFNRALPP
jgi:hypothetical protein